MPSIRFGSRTIRLPRSRAARTALGGGFILFGAVGFLPIVGFWMIPVGALILSADSPTVRRWNRRTTVKVLRWWHAFRRKPGSSSH